MKWDGAFVRASHNHFYGRILKVPFSLHWKRKKIVSCMQINQVIAIPLVSMTVCLFVCFETIFSIFVLFGHRVILQSLFNKRKKCVYVYVYRK